MADGILSNVLIVEDSALLAMHLRATLLDLGAVKVRSAFCLVDALSLLREDRFSLAILDIQLGDENGLVVADHCKEIGVPVILATGFADALEGAISPMELLLRKPYTASDLKRTIARLPGCPIHGDRENYPVEKTGSSNLPDASPVQPSSFCTGSMAERGRVSGPAPNIQRL